MANNNPTVIVGHLDDKEMRTFIERLVQNVEQTTQRMAESFDTALGRMQRSLNEFDKMQRSTTSETRRTSKERADSVEREQRAYDKLLGSLQYAKREVQMLGNKSFLPFGDLDRYAEALIRVNELQRRKNEADAQAALRNVNARQSVVDMKEYAKSIGASSEEMKRLNAYYKELEKTSARTAAQMASKDKGVVTFESDVVKGLPYIVNLNKNVDEQMSMIISKENALVAAKQREIEVSRELAEVQTRRGVSGFELGWGDVNAMQRTGNAYAQAKAVQQETVAYSSLEQTVARFLGISEQDLQLTIRKQGSYNALSAALSKMTAAYHEMSGSERLSGEGRNLAENIQRVQKALRDLQSQMSRPVSLKSAMGLSEKTLDDITYKMQMLASYRGGINLNMKGSAEEIRLVNTEYARLSQKQRELMGRNEELVKSNNLLNRSFNYIKNRIAFYLTVGAATMFVQQLVEVRSQYEMTERALGILVDSAERGTQIFQELSNMALVSPYTLIELSNAAKQLTAYDVAAKDVVDTTRRIADMTAAVGVPIERLTYALGQIKAYGYLNARDARMFANAGIPLVKQLSDYYTQLEGRLVSVGDVYDRIKKKAIGYNEVMAVVNKMTDEGGKFYDYQVKVADTLKVQLANFTLAWNNMLNEIGESSQGILTSGIGALKNLFLHWQTLARVLNDVVSVLGLLGAAYITVNLLLGTQTTKALASTLAMKNATAATYQQALADKNLSREKAILIAWFGRNNVALKEAIVSTGLLTKTEVANIGVTKVLSAAITLLKNGIVTLVGTVASAVVAFAPFIAIFAAVDFYHWVKGLGEVDKAISEGVAKSAKEAADSIHDMIAALDKAGTIKSVKSGNLSSGELDKTWARIREELETSADSNTHLLSDLMKIEDVSERIVAGFELARKIEAAQYKIKDLKVEISEDSWLGLADGLIQDVKDAQDAFEALRNYINTEWANEPTTNYLTNELNYAVEEADSEISKLAEHLKHEFSIHNIVNPEEISEAIERVRSQVKIEGNLQGAVADMFDIRFDTIMAKNFEGIHSEVTTIWNKVVETIRHDSSSAFSDLTDDIMSENGRWSKDQLDAIQKGIDKVKNDIPPQWSDTLDKLLADLNNRDFRIRLALEFDTTTTAFQKQYDDRIKKAYGDAAYTSTFKGMRPSESDDLVDWVKKRQDVIEELETQNAALVKDNTAWANEQIKSNKALIQANQDALDAFNQPYKKDKKKGGSKKDELGDAFKKEVEIITNIQKRYKEYRSAGVNAQEAIKKATEEYGRTLISVNSTLNKYGIKTKTSDELADMDLRSVREYYKSLLDMATSLGNTKGVEALEKAIANINVEITKVDYKKITEGLNSELAKLKEEYDLAVELDANPELGGIFADLFDIDVDSLPKTIDEYAERVVAELNKELAKDKIELPTLDITKDDLQAFRQMVYEGKLSEDNYKLIEKYSQEIRNMRHKDAVDTSKEWNKLLEKYGEFKARQLEIEKEYEAKMALARKKNADVDVLLAIENEKQQRISQEAFKEFQKNPAWATATGSLGGLSRDALKMLIDDIEKYKKSASNLKPKEIQHINKALVNLRKELKKNNPFAAISLAIDEARTRVGEYEQKIDELQTKIAFITQESKKKNNGVVSEKDQEQIEALNTELKHTVELKKAIEHVSADEVMGGIMQMRNAINSVTGSLQEMLKYMSEVGDNSSLKKASFFLENMSENINASMQGYEAGGGYGAAIAGVLDLIPRIIQGVPQWLAIDLDEQITKSEKAVTRLEIAYENLGEAMEDAYGTGAYAAKRLAITNKELQLQELQRQLYLERTKDSKVRDEDRINSLMSEINSLRNEIANAAQEITNDLLGITSVGDAAEEMVSSMIEAFKQGEDYMGVYEESFEKMIDNMIMKAIVSKVIGDKMEMLWKSIDEKVQERAQPEKQRAEDLQKKMSQYNRDELEVLRQRYELLSSVSIHGQSVWSDRLNDINEQLRQLDELEKQYNDALKAYEQAAIVTPSDVANVRFDRDAWEEDVKATFDALMEAWGVTFGESAKTTLSALQQGIQGITEDTAGAIEAYLNGVSQQVYLHSDLLTQIRDTIQSWSMNENIGVQAQMLLQLQQSFQVQQSIQSLLEGWNSADGRAIRVEMV